MRPCVFVGLGVDLGAEKGGEGKGEGDCGLFV